MNSPEETRKTEKSETVAKGNKKSNETGNVLWGGKYYEFWVLGHGEIQITNSVFICEA